MNNLHVDRAIKCVKNIADNNRCTVCDNADGHRVRYTCGHTACNSCVISAEDCLICLSPSASAKPDDVLTQRAKNATSLLNACQDLFNTNVYKRQRLSEQQRIEKELFPQCIQAPMKYENKRKSLNSSKTKENRRSSFFPGEGVPFNENKMENTVSYVQQWLNKNEGHQSRKPFADLNVNHQTNKNITKLKDLKRVNDENKPLCVEMKKRRTRSHFKTTIKNECPTIRKRTSIHSSDSHPKKVKSEFGQLGVNHPTEYGAMQQKNDNDESGIVIDDEPFVIDDSQDTANDKDRKAWLAVLEADKHKELESTSIRLESREDTNIVETPLLNKHKNINNLSLKVPFYKKSYLFETCKYCNNENITFRQPKVKITIESDRFITTVQVLNTAEKNYTDNSKKSVPVQTNISEMLETNNKSNIENTNGTEFDNKCKMEIPKQSQAFDMQSGELFADEGIIIPKETDVQKKSLVIDESDSDVDNEYSGPIYVTADIHRSCEELESGILADVVDQEDHSARPRRGPRGHTPTSTDSSDKENCNPNRIKRIRLGKKKKTKK